MHNLSITQNSKEDKEPDVHGASQLLPPLKFVFVVFWCRRCGQMLFRREKNVGRMWFRLMLSSPVLISQFFLLNERMEASTLDPRYAFNSFFYESELCLFCWGFFWISWVLILKSLCMTNFTFYFDTYIGIQIASIWHR